MTCAKQLKNLKPGRESICQKIYHCVACFMNNKSQLNNSWKYLWKVLTRIPGNKWLCNSPFALQNRPAPCIPFTRNQKSTGNALGASFSCLGASPGSFNTLCIISNGSVFNFTLFPEYFSSNSAISLWLQWSLMKFKRRFSLTSGCRIVPRRKAAKSSVCVKSAAASGLPMTWIVYSLFSGEVCVHGHHVFSRGWL